MEIEEAFGVILKEFRTEISLSQEELADICDLDRTYISLMKRGKRRPAITTIFALAMGLNQQASDLVIAAEKLLDSNTFSNLE